MALTVRKNNLGVIPGQPGFKLQTGIFDFTTTSQTGELPLQMHGLYSLQLTPIGAPAGQEIYLNVGDQGTVSATAVAFVRCSHAGTITGFSIAVNTTVAVDDTNYWSIGVINKASGAGTAVVVDGTAAANTNKATGGAAFTADTPRALTITSTAGDLVVAEGDLLEITFTKNSSAANLVGLSATGALTTAGTDESAYLDESSLAGTKGMIIVPSTGTVTIGRKGANPTSGQKYSFLAIGY